MSFPIKRKGSRKDKRGGVKRKVYNIPDKIDLLLHKEKIQLLSKNLDDNGRPKPLTENQLKAIIRSALRKKWMSCNQKLAFLESRKVPDMDPLSRRLWKLQCEICKDWFSMTEVEVDHRKGENKLNSLDDIFTWARAILDVGGEEDLSLLCGETCHPIKTIMESHNLTFEEAGWFKKMTAWEKSIPLVGNQKKFLINKGFLEEEVSNKEKRRECYIKYLKKRR